MKNIHLLPTEKPSKLAYVGANGLCLGKDYPNTPYCKPQHIYITSDEEIKDREICITFGSDKCNGQLDTFQSNVDYRRSPRKIILTTDQDLIKDGVQAIDDEFLEWFVKNPSCESVEIDIYSKKIGVETDTNGYRKMDVFGNDYRIIIPQEEPNYMVKGGSDAVFPSSTIIEFNIKQETLEDFLYQHWFDSPTCYKSREEFINGGLLGAKWQAERMYSEEEVLKSADYLGFKQITSKELNSLSYQPFITDEDGNIWVIDKDKWFKQFEKKQ